MEQLDSLIEQGKRSWFYQDPVRLSPILEALRELDQTDDRIRLWRRYFEGVELHYRKQFKAADEAFRALARVVPESEATLLGLIARNRAVVSNLLFKDDPFEALDAALSKAMAAGDTHTVGTIQFNLGLTCGRFGREEEAFTYQVRAIDNFRACNDARGVFAAMEFLSFNDALLENPSKLSAHIDEMADLADSIGDLDLKRGVILRRGVLYLEQGEYRTALATFEQSLDLQYKIDPTDSAAIGINQCTIANTYWSIGDHRQALDWGYRALDTFKSVEVTVGEIAPAEIIALVLADMGRFDESLRFSLKAHSVLERLGNRRNLASSLTSIGFTYTRAGDPVTALEWLERAVETAGDDAIPFTRALLHIGLYEAHTALKNTESAKESATILESLVMHIDAPRLLTTIMVITGIEAIQNGDLEKVEATISNLEQHPLMKEAVEVQLDVMMLRSRFLQAQGNLEAAIDLTRQRIGLAETHLMRNHELDAHQQLLTLFKAKLDVERFFSQYERVDEIRSEIQSAQQQRQLALMSIEREYEAERLQSVAREELLNNVLPSGIAERLLGSSSIIADEHDDVAVIFLDIVSFTDLAAAVPPGHVIHLLNAIFQTCDEVMREHHITKIKTIGDAYLAVAGAPEPSAELLDEPSNVARAAKAVISLRARLDTLQVTMPPELGDRSWVKNMGDLNVRIGCHVGSVVAGVVGTDRVAYDVWGDAVNIAARMEQTCEPGRIQVSDDFAKALPGATRPEFDDNDRVILKSDIATLIQRGNIPIKGKGDIKTWWLV